MLLEAVDAVLEGIKIPETLLSEIYAHIKDMNTSNNEFQNKQVRSLRIKLQQIQSKKNSLLDAFIHPDNKSITQHIYDEKVEELHNQEKQITGELEKYLNATQQFELTLSALISLCNEAKELFHKASIDKKRKILKLLFSNFEMQGETLYYTLRKPFDKLAKIDDCLKWCTRRDSNP